MPVYQYIDPAGKTCEMVRPVAERDVCPMGWKRVTVPQSLAVVGFRVDPSAAVGTVPKAFKDLEQRMNYRQIEKESGFSADTIKRVWNM